MDNLILYRDKPQRFKCELEIDSISSEETNIRMCLEMGNNKNLFFNGILEENGNCTINIPKISEFESQKGKMVIEAIASNNYFKLYESDFELKNYITVKMAAEGASLEIVDKGSVKLVNVESVDKPTGPTIKVDQPVKQKTKPEVKSEDKPEVKPEVKPAAKPAAKPAVKKPTGPIIKKSSMSVEEELMSELKRYINNG